LLTNHNHVKKANTKSVQVAVADSVEIVAAAEAVVVTVVAVEAVAVVTAVAVIAAVVAVATTEIFNLISCLHD
jgi:hypothetical protein